MADMIVSTFQRGGSSLVMQMLYAGGLDCAGQAPAFEDVRSGARAGLGNDASWIRFEDGAVKLLEPQRFRTGQRVALTGLWLDREPKIRARSTLRFLEATGVPVMQDRHALRTLAAAYARDRKQALFHLSGLCAGNVMILRFEDILRDPARAAGRIAGLIPHRPLDRAAMASVVIRRPEGLAPFLLEPHLINAWSTGRIAVRQSRTDIAEIHPA